MIRHTREVFQGTPVYDFVAGTENAYATNSLNQYTEICSAGPNQQTATPSNQLSALQLSYDDDGNMTSVQTSTGTWNVEYNAENRPVRWTNAATGTVITMTFDSQGRRTEYKSVTNGAQNTWLRFLYDGYLCVQVLYSNEPYNVFKEFVWDPTEPVATRPLVFRYAPNSLNLFYAFDGNKNVSDVFYRMTSNGIGAHYDYAPFGATTRTHRDSSAAFDIVTLNPFRFSSEYYDSELDLVYYNYRHYSPSLGRFLSRDPIEEQGGWNLYVVLDNKMLMSTDRLGLAKSLTNKRCENQIRIARKDSRIVRLERVLKKTCGTPSFECECCSGNENGSYTPRYWLFWGNKITICSNAPKFRTRPKLSDYVDTLTHELIHAIQFCNDKYANMYGTNCRKMMCMEIEAMYNGTFYEIKDSYWIKKRIFERLKAYKNKPQCKKLSEEDFRNLFDEIFDSCKEKNSNNDD